MWLTLLRVVLIPVLVVCFYWEFPYHSFFAALTFSVAAITDWLDGYLARKWQQTTRFGAFLDPVADKLLVVVALCMLIEQHASLWLTLPALVIVCREIIISALREWMAEIGHSGRVAVAWLGKVKTTAQMTALITLLLFPPDSIFFMLWLGYVALYAAAVLTLWSMVSYLKLARDAMT